MTKHNNERFNIMTNLEKIQQLCDDALCVAERSSAPQKETICSLVTVIGLMTEHNKETKEKAVNYIAHLRNGHTLPKHKIIEMLLELTKFEGL